MEEECVGVRGNNIHESQSQSTTSSSRSKVFRDFVEKDQNTIRNKASTALSMSQLREDEYSVSNCQHEFDAEVLDDDDTTTTSGVLDTFEISSSNSIPTSSDTTAALSASAEVVDVEDSASDYTIKNEKLNVSLDSTYNASAGNEEVYIINHIENDIIQNDIGKEELVAADVQILSNENTSHFIKNVEIERQMNGVIMTADGSKIFLETPMVEEQLNNHNQIGDVAVGQNHHEKAGKPKRLSDDFMFEESGEQTSSEQIPTSTIYAQTASCNFVSGESMEIASSSSSSESVSAITKGIKSDTLGSISNNAESMHDRIMSVRLKQMSLTNTTSGSVTDNSPDELPTFSSSGSQLTVNQTQPPSIADIESMDLIERRDFETEQLLTGGPILKSSSIINKNMLNISLIKSCVQHQNNKGAAKDQTIAAGDEWPSSSNVRIVSSDSKCTYKDIASTPTTSRKYNSRLTKSTAKINLCSSLSQPQQQQQHSLAQLSKTSQQTACASSQIVEPTSIASLSNSLASHSEKEVVSTASDVTGAEVYNSNSNTNENFESAAGERSQHDDNYVNIAQPSSSTTTSTETQQLTAEGGCSRTRSLHSFSNALTYDNDNEHVDNDPQPSTSSARCQYAPPPRNTRQVNASAQTSERFVSRGSLSGGHGGCSNVAPLNGNRSRRRADSSAQTTYSSGLDGVVLVVDGEVGVERGEFNADDSWADCDEENIYYDYEEVCTCQNNAIDGSSHGGSNTSLNETNDMLDNGDNYTDGLQELASTDSFLATSSSYIAPSTSSAPLIGSVQQRKRKYNDGRLQDSDYCLAVSSSGGSIGGGGIDNCRKRIAYDLSSTPRSSQATSASFCITASNTPVANFVCGSATSAVAGSPLGRRTPRSLLATRDNPPQELHQWLSQFQRWTHSERLVAVDRLIDHCDPSQVRHMMKVIEPQFQRDFISLLPRELALSVLSYLDPKDLLRAAQTCRSWRFLCDDNLLWKEKCRKAQILTEPRTDRPKRGRAGNMPPIASPWKAAYMRQHIIEMNWRSRPVRDPKVLKGHDDHVITCLQFSGNRIVSGSDDNTLKVWSAITGRCLRTLVGHTGGVWSSQMSGNIIISGSTDRTLKVWDMETGQCVHTLQGHTSTVRCMHLHGNKVVSGSRDATLRVWDIEQGSCLHVLVGHLAAVRCVQYDGKLIVSGAYDYMVKIWHPERQECLHTLQGHTNRVYSLQFDGLHVVSGSLDTSIRVWDVENGNCKHTLMGHQSLTSGMELRQNILVSGNADSTVKVWDITTGQCLQTLSGPNKHQSAVTCLQFNSRFVVTSSDDGTVKLWDVNTGEFIRNLVALDSGGSGGVVWRIRANDTKLICAVGSRNGTEETKLMVLDFDVEGACAKCS